MEVLKKLSNKELIATARAEAAKGANELRCAMGDLNKINERFKLINIVIKELNEREENK